MDLYNARHFKSASVSIKYTNRTTNIMLNGHQNELPPLPRVPGMAGDPLVFRISHTGATLLKAGSVKKRFTGGEAVVDINGKLYISKKDLIGI